MPIDRQHKTPFVLASVQGGTMILNCLDCSPEEKQDGPCGDMLHAGFRDPALTTLVLQLGEGRRKSHGDGVVIIDGGAHVGSYTIPWARHIRGWGTVLAFEPQRWIYMALCGNAVINNCFNIEAVLSALGEAKGSIRIPRLDPAIPCNSGGIHAGEGEDRVPLVAIDDLRLGRCDIIKMDLEGMEPQALRGARDTLQKHKPIIIAEHFICGVDEIFKTVPGYHCIGIGADLLCVHHDDDARLLSDMEEMAKRLKYEMVQV